MRSYEIRFFFEVGSGNRSVWRAEAYLSCDGESVSTGWSARAETPEQAAKLLAGILRRVVEEKERT